MKIKTGKTPLEATNLEEKLGGGKLTRRDVGGGRIYLEPTSVKTRLYRQRQAIRDNEAEGEIHTPADKAYLEKQFLDLLDMPSEVKHRKGGMVRSAAQTRDYPKKARR